MKKDKLKFKILLFCLSLFCVVAVNAQPTFQWAKTWGSTTNNEGFAIVTDAFGNVYTTGYFSGPCDFDPGIGTYSVTSTGWGLDIFISKVDVNGNFVWAKTIGGNGGDAGKSIKIDATGNILVTGRFQSTNVDFDPGAGVNNLTSAGYDDIFVLKLDPNGNFIWAKSFGSINYDEGYSISSDASGNVYTTGSFAGTTDFDPTASTFTLTTVGGNTNCFISKLDANGNFVWAKQFTGLSTSSSVGASIVLDGSGNIHIGGAFTGPTVDFDPSAASYTLAALNMDIFITKLDGSGNFIWAKGMGSAGGSNIANSIFVDASSNVYSTGYFQNTVDFDPGAGTFNLSSFGNSLDIFVSKLNASGNFVLAKQLGGTSNDEGRSINISSSGEIYTTGYFDTAGDFDPGAASYTLGVAGGNGIFISKLDVSGNFLWAGSVASGNSYGNGISVDPYSDIHVTGRHAGITDFDPGVGTYTIQSNGSNDAFVLKLGQSICPTFSINSSTSSYTLMCALNSLTLNAINTSSLSGVTYTWTAPSSATASGSSYTLGASGIYTVKASVGSNTCIVTQVVSIIQSTGNVNFNINTSGSICNNNGTASVNVTSGTAPYTYTWSAGGTGTTVSNLAPGNYTVKVTDANLCSLTQSFSIINAASSFSSVPICYVTVDSLSQYNVITWDKASFPNADSFYVYRETGTNVYQLIRKQPYSGFSRFVDTVKTLYFPNTGNPNVGTYRYKMKVKDNCSNFSDYSPYHNTLFMVNNNGTFSWTQLYQIEGDPNPVLSYILERDNLNNNNWAAVGSVAGTQQFIIDPNYSTYQATAAWRVRTQWNISCIPSKSTTSLTASYSNRVTNNNVGIKTNTIEQYLSIYPNPTNGKVNIDLKNTTSSLKIITFEISNVTGQKIYTSNGEISVNTQIDLSGNASGIYFITLRTENKVLKGKLVIDK